MPLTPFRNVQGGGPNTIGMVLACLGLSCFSVMWCLMICDCKERVVCSPQAQGDKCWQRKHFWRGWHVTNLGLTIQKVYYIMLYHFITFYNNATCMVWTCITFYSMLYQNNTKYINMYTIYIYIYIHEYIRYKQDILQNSRRPGRLAGRRPGGLALGSGPGPCLYIITVVLTLITLYFCIAHIDHI